MIQQTEVESTWLIPKLFLDLTDTREHLETLGFEIVEDDDPVFYQVLPLEGWTMEKHGIMVIFYVVTDRKDQRMRYRNGSDDNPPVLDSFPAEAILRWRKIALS